MPVAVVAQFEPPQLRKQGLVEAPARGKVVVVVGGNGKHAGAEHGHTRDRADDIAGREGDVLHAGTRVGREKAAGRGPPALRDVQRQARALRPELTMVRLRIRP